MGKLEIASPCEVYDVNMPKKVVTKVEELLKSRRSKNPLEPIAINVSDLERILLSEEQAFDADVTLQDALEALLLLCSEKWDIEHKEAVLYFAPFVRDESRHKLRSTSQFKHQENRGPGIGTR